MVWTYTLVGREVRREPVHPQLNYSIGRGRKFLKKLLSLTNQLYYHYMCNILTAPIVSSPPPSMETLQLAKLCICVLKFQTKLISVLKLL